MKNVNKKQIALLMIGLFTWVLGSSSLAQNDFQGKAIYQSHQKMNINIDSNEVSDERQAALNAMIAKQFNKTYELHFDQRQSNYKEEEKLEEPAQATEGMVMVMFSDASSILYKNISENRFSSQRDLFGKTFLVKDKLEERAWKLLKETKQIGEYTCYKATSMRTTDVRVSIDEKGNRTEEPAEEITITAWYAPSIPVSNGPELYYGLPGLIMEVHDDNKVIICSQLTLNTDKKIVEPENGKVVSEEEYNALMEKKMKEMQKIESGGKKNGDQHSLRITIEG